MDAFPALAPEVPKKKPGRVPKLRRREPEGEGILRAMRAVWVNAEEFDRGGEELAMRAYLKKDPRGFLADMESREKGLVSGEDGNEGEIEKLIGRLLREGQHG